MTTLETLQYADFPSYLSGFSALERFFSLGDGEIVIIETEGSIVDLSRLFDGIFFTGSSPFDAGLQDEDGGFILFRCIDDADGHFGGSSIAAALSSSQSSRNSEEWAGIGDDMRGSGTASPGSESKPDNKSAGPGSKAPAGPGNKAPAGQKGRRPFLRTLPPPSPKISLIPQGFSLQGSLLYDLSRGAFIDRASSYYLLRDKRLLPGRGTEPSSATGRGCDSWYPVFETALIVARLGYELSPELHAALCGRRGEPTASEDAYGNAPVGLPGTRAGDLTGRETRPAGPAEAKTKPGGSRSVSPAPFSGQGRGAGEPEPLSSLEQRFLLTGVLTGKWAGRGLSLLMESGFIAAHWPLLQAMNRIDHSKEHHPEGNVWRHTVEAFAYRKVRELPLSLALLLHDSGKPFTGPRNGNAFDRHAQIGADRARGFLRDLGYGEELISQVDYFVRHHMLPSYIPRLAFSRTEDVLSSPHFPELLELYRCDVSSTYRGPDGYYAACATYRSFLKNRRNPFRSASGKKRLRLLVE